MTMRQHSRTTYERSRSGIRRPADAPDTDAVFGRIAALRNGPERTALRQVVVCAWTPMAERLARRFRHRGETSEDLSRVARLGLVKAVAGFDPGAGSAFPSFAVPTILAEVKRHFRDDLWAGRMPGRVQEVRGPVRAAGHELDAEPGGRGPSVPEIAAHTGLSESDVRLGQAASQSFASVSLEAAPGRSAGSRRPAHTLGELEPGIDRAADRAALRPVAGPARTGTADSLHEVLRRDDPGPHRPPARHLAEVRLPSDRPHLRDPAAAGHGRRARSAGARVTAPAAPGRRGLPPRLSAPVPPGTLCS